MNPAYARLGENLHFHLANDFVAEPDMHVPIWKFCLTLFESLKIFDAIGPGFIEKPIRSEATYEGISTELNTYFRVSSKIDGLEAEMILFHGRAHNGSKLSRKLRERNPRVR